MAPKHHPTPLSGGDRKALSKELVKSRAMTGILAERAEEKRRVGEALIREADNLACQSWNEKMWSTGGPAQPSPTIGQAVNGGLPWLEVKCSRCRTPSSIDLAATIHSRVAVMRTDKSVEKRQTPQQPSPPPPKRAAKAGSDLAIGDASYRLIGVAECSAHLGGSSYFH
jgi:hypothetical protein